MLLLSGRGGLRALLLLAACLLAGSRLVTGSGVEIYTTPGCRYCQKAKGFLTARGVPVFEIDVSMEPGQLDEMIRRSEGHSTLPQIFIGGEWIGGCDRMLAAHKTGRLAVRLAKCGLDLKDAPKPDPSTPRPDDDAPPLLQPFLNPTIIPARGEMNAVDLARKLQIQMLRMQDEFLSSDGSRVDYAALRRSSSFAEFCGIVGELGRLPIASLLEEPVEQRTAFWMNLYNCFVMHATVALGAPTDPPSRKAFFSGSSGAVYRVGSLLFSLDDIEHGILRCNTPPPGASDSPFDASDERKPLSLTRLDPRLHFALNCGARSCPPIKVYHGEKLDQELGLATRAFLEDDLEVDLLHSCVTCTKILDWYGADFGSSSREIVSRLRSFLADDSPLASKLDQLLQHGAAEQLELRHRDYDWGLNDLATGED